MAKMQRFNKLVAIAPSEEFPSGIHINYYAYRIADIAHGYLDIESKEKQVFLMGGYTKALGASALQSTESLRTISQILEDEFMISSDIIVPHAGEVIGRGDSFAAGIRQYPEFFAEAQAGIRKMGLIADELQMSLGGDALGVFNIQRSEFQVMMPKFGTGDVEMNVVQPPISIDTYRSEREPEASFALTGDS